MRRLSGRVVLGEDAGDEAGGEGKLAMGESKTNVRIVIAGCVLALNGANRRISFSALPADQQERITNMYEQAIKLSAENKINTKNTWSFDLLDHMHAYVKRRRESGVGVRSGLSGGGARGRSSTGASGGSGAGASSEQVDVSFARASALLDATVKVWSYRVDDVWSSSCRVLESLSRGGGKAKGHPEEEVEGGAEGEAEGEEEGVGEKKGKKGKGAGGGKGASAEATLAADVDTLDCDAHELADGAADPLFHKMSRALDAGGAQSLLMATLGVHKGCTLSVRDEAASAASAPGGSRALSGLMAIDALSAAFLAAGGAEQPLCPWLGDAYADLDTASAALRRVRASGPHGSAAAPAGAPCASMEDADLWGAKAPLGGAKDKAHGARAKKGADAKHWASEALKTAQLASRVAEEAEQNEPLDDDIAVLAMLLMQQQQQQQQQQQAEASVGAEAGAEAATPSQPARAVAATNVPMSVADYDGGFGEVTLDDDFAAGGDGSADDAAPASLQDVFRAADDGAGGAAAVAVRLQAALDGASLLTVGPEMMSGAFFDVDKLASLKHWRGARQWRLRARAQQKMRAERMRELTMQSADDGGAEDDAAEDAAGGGGGSKAAALDWSAPAPAADDARLAHAADPAKLRLKSGAATARTADASATHLLVRAAVRHSADAVADLRRLTQFACMPALAVAPASAPTDPFPAISLPLPRMGTAGPRAFASALVPLSLVAVRAAAAPAGAPAVDDGADGADGADALVDYDGGFGEVDAHAELDAPKAPAHADADTPAAVPGAPRLVDEVRRVGKVGISYEKVAKRVDVKQLKDDVWNSVVSALGPTPAHDESHTHPSASATSSASSSTSTSTSTSLASLVRNLAPSQSKAITTPFYFITLLHLANEHGLLLRDTPTLSDVAISWAQGTTEEDDDVHDPSAPAPQSPLRIRTRRQ